MASGAIAAVVAVLALGFVESLRRFYPTRETWRRLRRVRGRLAVRLMRERFESESNRKSPKRLAEILICLMIAWVASSSLLDKRWQEVVIDVLPYAFVTLALFRVPAAMGAIGQRMREYEESVGEDPDQPWRDDEPGDGGPAVIAL
ncbi:MAG: hypothetical protein QOG54_1990 [Actinomycetota bacterium]|jgi:hypothetical protein|nr:hypothetical protein [Actinomycetota bacterium]